MHTVTILKIIEETAEVKSFLLGNSVPGPIPYKPGQFLTFLFKDRWGKEERRNYSLASSPLLQESLQITVKRIPNGTNSRWLHEQARVGDELTTIGASGFFVLPEQIMVDTKFVFFAAGSGIVPVFSLIKSILFGSDKGNIILVYSSTTPENTVFHKALQELVAQFSDRFILQFLYSRPIGAIRTRLNQYMIEGIASRFSDQGKRHFYLCGPFEYMRMIAIVLRTSGIPESAIHREIFEIILPKDKPQPPDKLPHFVSVELAGSTYSFKSEYPETLLQSAKKQGIFLPYGCEAGQCGTCAATCISGKVWMWRNDVLLDEEIAKGRVLTCTGYAIGGDVSIRF